MNLKARISVDYSSYSEPKAHMLMDDAPYMELCTKERTETMDHFIKRVESAFRYQTQTMVAKMPYIQYQDEIVCECEI